MSTQSLAWFAGNKLSCHNGEVTPPTWMETVLSLCIYYVGIVEPLHDIARHSLNNCLLGHDFTAADTIWRHCLADKFVQSLKDSFLSVGNSVHSAWPGQTRDGPVSSCEPNMTGQTAHICERQGHFMHISLLYICYNVCVLRTTVTHCLKRLYLFICPQNVRQLCRYVTVTVPCT